MKRNAVLLAGAGLLGFFLIQSQPLFAETQAEVLSRLATEDPQSSEVRAKAVFAGFDKDENKSLDTDEFAKVVIQYFAVLDGNHDEMLVTEELPRGWNPELEALDANKDKKVQFMELFAAIDHGFKTRDLDQDGKLSYGEVKAQIEKNKLANG